jgi:hypothetical protein
MPGISADPDALDLALILRLPAQSDFMPLSQAGTTQPARGVYCALPRE